MLIRRYLARAVLLRASLALVALALIYLGVLFVDQGRAEWARTSGWATAIHVGLLRLPLIAVQVAPVALMLGAALALVALRGRGELEALACLGAAPRRLWTPVIMVGLQFCLLTLAVDELVVPPCERAIDARLGRRSLSPLTGLPRRAAWFRRGRWIFHADDDRVMGLELGPGFQPLRRVDASVRAGRVHEVVETALGRRVRRTRVATAPAGVEHARELSRRTAERAEDLDAMSLRRRLDQLERAGQRRTAERLVLHSKLAYPLLNVVVALFACLLFRARPSTPVGMMAAAVTVVLVLWLALAAGWVLARTGWIGPAVAVWGPVTAAGLVALTVLLASAFETK